MAERSQTRHERAGARARRQRPGAARRTPAAARPAPDAPGLLYGTHPVAEALRAGRRRIERLWVRRGRRARELEDAVARARALGVPVEEVDADALARLVPAGARTQGAVLEAGPLPEVPLDALLAASRGEPRRIVALSGVEDPQNAGAIARVAEAAGACGMIVTRRRAPPLGAALARASAGAIEHLPVARVPNLVRALNFLKENGFWVIGGDAEAELDVFACGDHLLAGDLVLVLGGEGRGLRAGVRGALDAVVRVPLAGKVASLNVSTAAAVVLFEARRRAGVASRA